MKSMTWTGSTRSAYAVSKTLLTLLASTALVLVMIGCAKEAQSEEMSTKSLPQVTDKMPPKAAALATPPTLKATPVATPGAAVVPANQATPHGEKTVGGDKSYTLKLDVPSNVKTGSEGAVRVMVVPKSGWKMNKEFPTKLKVTAPDGVTVGKPVQVVADAERFDDAGATFALKFKADSAGAKSFAANFKFAVCTDTTCDPKREKLAWVVNVE